MDDYLDVHGVAKHLRISERSVRRWLVDPERPMPHVRLLTPGKGKGLIRVSRQALEAWVEQFAVAPGRPATQTVDEAVAEMVRRSH